MAKKVVTQTTYIDDLDGGSAVGTVTFGFDGAHYEIDLSKSNQRALGKALALYVGHARKVRSARPRKATSRNNGHDLTAVRAWAKSAGYEVSQRGRVAATVLEAYDAAH